MVDTIEEIVQSFWYGSGLSPIERLCLSSFTSRGVGVDLYTYDEDLDVPEGVVLRDAGEIYDEEAVFTYQEGPGEGSVAAFANMFRYKLLHERGGWWVDTDVLYTGHSLPKKRTFFGKQNESKICNAIMRVEKCSTVARECLTKAEELREEVTWGEAGPDLLTEVVRRQGKMDHVSPSDYTYPLSWWDAPDVYDPAETASLRSKVNRKEAPFLHLWNEILRRIGIQKTIAPPADSYLHEVSEEIGIDWPNPSVRYSADAIGRMCENYRTAQEAEWRSRQIKQIKNSRTWKILKFLRLDFSD